MSPSSIRTSAYTNPRASSCLFAHTGICSPSRRCVAAAGRLVTDVAATRNDDSCIACEYDNQTTPWHLAVHGWWKKSASATWQQSGQQTNLRRVTRDKPVIGGDAAQPHLQTEGKAARLSHRANTSKQLAVDNLRAACEQAENRQVCHCLKSSDQP
ncbi:hypothetical protein VFPPC_18762 [Pochonia chlamydosporia 170]|uniref:Uncharacterized protein n=1 Tax=Pochonia chlamydosporia 170 TaxID=1380566 RepID=A0A219ARW7_METCM|nr:hypothetical protein VFPPC_18762 [Pochonia chlamydosporia 170]OWT43511.1 hypothetical protein VFPPC_18762 [Pochonia chlamydosporia 170]